jgi:hypothetical protein
MGACITKIPPTLSSPHGPTRRRPPQLNLESINDSPRVVAPEAPRGEDQSFNLDSSVTAEEGTPTRSPPRRPPTLNLEVTEGVSPTFEALPAPRGDDKEFVLEVAAPIVPKTIEDVLDPASPSVKKRPPAIDFADTSSDFESFETPKAPHVLKEFFGSDSETLDLGNYYVNKGYTLDENGLVKDTEENRAILMTDLTPATHNPTMWNDMSPELKAFYDAHIRIREGEDDHWRFAF